VYVVGDAEVGVVIGQIFEEMLVTLVGGIMGDGVSATVDAFVEVDHTSLLLDEGDDALLVSEHNQHHEVCLIHQDAVAHYIDYGEEGRWMAGFHTDPKIRPIYIH
jgi:hypothetical protein